MSANGVVRGDVSRWAPRRERSTPLFRPDRVRPIDCYIDYFGDVNGRSARTAAPTAPFDHTVVHVEIPADDPERTMRFHRELFGWGIQKLSANGGPECWTISTRPEAWDRV